MHLRRSVSKALSRTCILAMCPCFFFGCDAVPLGAPGSANQRPTPSFADFPPVTDPVIEEVADNSAFEFAQPATLPVDGEFHIQGSIDSLSDIDLYAMGPAERGDRITVDVSGSDGINTLVSLFDADMNIIDANDDRSYYGGLLDPFVSLVLRQDTGNVYVGISLSSGQYFTSTQGRHPGAYNIRMQRKPSQTVRESTHQIVWLDFEGGDAVQIAQQPIENMRPFSAESISSRHSGKTDYIANLVVQHMRRDVEGFNVTLVSSKESPEPGELHSTLFFGNHNSSFLGLADSVDTGNNIAVQEAIIYTEDLSRWESLSPTAEETAMAIANIASHELGHLLGMEHTNEAGDLMAIAASAGQVLDIDAVYRQASLQSAVFPVGWQDSYALLLQNVGASHDGATARVMLQDLLPAAPPPRPNDLPINMCDRCCGH